MNKSMLKDQIEELKLVHKYELGTLKRKQLTEKERLLNTCDHQYDDGSSARIRRGIVDDFGYDCAICGEDLE